MRRAKLQTNRTIFNKQTQILVDIDIIGRSQEAAQEAFLALEREANKVGLKINENKTKYMIAVGNGKTIRDVGQSVAVHVRFTETHFTKCIFHRIIFHRIIFHRKHFSPNAYFTECIIHRMHFLPNEFFTESFFTECI
jgi:hypothetical protein